MDTIKTIKSRRSIRKFQYKPVDSKLIDSILETGRWPLSGLNNLPAPVFRICCSDEKPSSDRKKLKDLVLRRIL